MRQRHTLRISSIEKGKSNLDAQTERQFIEGMDLDQQIKNHKKLMVQAGRQLGPIWEWLASIRGLKEGGLTAQLLAQIDDIGKFGTISKLWRVTGQGVYDYWATPSGKIVAPAAGYKTRKARTGEWVLDGTICEPGRGKKAKVNQVVRERVVPVPKPGWVKVRHIDLRLEDWNSPYNARLKSICYLIADQFIKQQTPGYVDIYYAEKERQRRLHPEKIKDNGKWKFNDGHLHHRAMRKTIKIFLQHLWLKWREFEGLPISEPYVQAIMGHTNIIQPGGDYGHRTRHANGANWAGCVASGDG
jgi:hypothetical protein